MSNEIVFNSPRLARAVRAALEKPPLVYGVSPYGHPDDVVPTPVETYKGQFKVGVMDGGLYIYDGANWASPTAGIIFAGSRAQAFPKTLLETTEGEIYAILEYRTTSPFWFTDVHQGNIADSPYISNPRAAHFLIASYVGEEIIQQHVTGPIYVTGRWLA